MAQIDSSIYLQQQTPDIAGGIQQGMKLRDLARQSKLADNEQKYNETMKGAVIQDPATGALSFDKSKLSSLANIDPVKALAMQQQQRQQAAEQQKLDFEQKNQKYKDAKEKTEFATNVLGGVHDDGTYAGARKALIAAGFPEAEIPEKHDPEWVKNHVGLGLDMKTRLEKEHREHEAAWKERELGQADTKIKQTDKEHELKHEENMTRMADVKERSAAGRNDRLERQDNTIHARVVSKLQSDPVLRGKLTQYQNLNSALSNFENAEHPTPQAFDELQQALRANLGIKGASAVGEREHTTMNSLGLNASRFQQFLTGNPADMAKDTGFAKHMKDLVKLERQNIERQVNGHLNTLTAGHGSMYKRRSDLMGDLQDAKGSFGSEFNGANSGGAPAAPASAFHEMSDADLDAAYKAAGGK